MIRFFFTLISIVTETITNPFGNTRLINGLPARIRMGSGDPQLSDATVSGRTAENTSAEKVTDIAPWFKLIFFTLIGFTLLTFFTSLYLASLPKPTVQQVELAKKCTSAWQTAGATFGGLLLGKAA